MRVAAPYPVTGRVPIVRHRHLGGPHRGHHRGRGRGRHVRRPRRARPLNAAALAVSVAAVPAAWWLLLTGAGLPTTHPSPSAHAPAEQPRREQVLPPISVAPPASPPATAPPRPSPTDTPDPTGTPSSPTLGSTPPPAAPQAAPAPAPATSSPCRKPPAHGRVKTPNHATPSPKGGTP